MTALKVTMPSDSKENVAPKKTKKVVETENSDDSPSETETKDVTNDVVEVNVLDVESPTRVDNNVGLEDFDDSEELWDGGPTMGDLRNWRESYGKIYITAINVDEGVVWRTLKRSEYREHVRYIEGLQEDMSSVDLGMVNEEVIAHRVILYPEYDTSFDDAPAGVPSLIAQQVMESSGFVALDVREI